MSPMGLTPPPATERVARELAPLRRDPERLREAWAGETAARANQDPERVTSHCHDKHAAARVTERTRF